MSKKFAFMALIASLLMVSNAFAISITVHLADQAGKELSQANCLAVDSNKHGHLFSTDMHGKAQLEDVNGHLDIHCQTKADATSKPENHHAKVDTETQHGKVQMSKQDLLSISIGL